MRGDSKPAHFWQLGHRSVTAGLEAGHSQRTPDNFPSTKV